jgi:formyltetrahydrofolate deformylase
MQILSHEFVHRYPQRIINIHHSFLPAFAPAGIASSAATRIRISASVTRWIA